MSDERNPHMQEGSPMHRALELCHGDDSSKADEIMELVQQVPNAELLAFYGAGVHAILARHEAGAAPCPGCRRTKTVIMCEFATRLADPRLLRCALGPLEACEQEESGEQTVTEAEEPQAPTPRRTSSGETIH